MLLFFWSYFFVDSYHFWSTIVINKGDRDDSDSDIDDVTVVDLAAATGYFSAPCLLLICFSRYDDHRLLLESILTFYLSLSIYLICSVELIL